MVCTYGLYKQPKKPYAKIMYKSIFPTSNANFDSRIRFYTNFDIRINTTGGESVIFYIAEAAEERNYGKKWHKIVVIPLITSIKHCINLI